MQFNKIKSIIYSFLIFIFSISFFTSVMSVEVKDYPNTCKSFSKAILGESSNVRYYHYDFFDIGVYFDFEYDKDKHEVIIKRDKKDNYPVVRFSLINNEDIKSGTIIKSYKTIDGIKYDLSKLDDFKIKDIFQNKESATLELSNGKSVKIRPISYKLNNFDLHSFGLTSIQKIDSTNGFVEITFNSTTSSSRPDLKKILVKKNIFIDEWYEPICNEIDSLIHFPIEYFKFNEFKYDEDIRSGVHNKTKLNTQL